MYTYKVLVVDDEEEIRDGMVRKVDWTSLGFEIVGTAENGVEALEVAEQEKPDVIMTDIRMPYMDGLELVEQVSMVLPGIKIIVFSGFEDFEYAQRAIRLGVHEYILKPVSAVDLEKSLYALREKMDEEVEKRRDVALLEKSYQESLPLLKQQFLARVIEGWTEESDIAIKMQQYDIDLDEKHKTVILFGVDNIGIKLNHEHRFAGKEELIPISMQQTVESIIGSNHRSYSFIYGAFLVVIVGFKRGDEITKIYQEVNQVCKECRLAIEVDITAGIGKVYHLYKELNFSYQDAQKAWEYATMFQKSEEYTVYSKDLEVLTTSAIVHMEEVNERMLTMLIKNNDMDRLSTYFQEVFQKLEDARLPFYEYQTYILEILAIIMKLANTFQIDASTVWGVENIYLSAIFRQHSLEMMCEWFIESCRKIGKQIQVETKDPGAALIDKAKNYLEEHYADMELSVEVLCEELHVSPAYFSTLFKRETEMNFVSYVTDLRVEHAKKLLDSTADKTYIIAEKVGYSDSNYFAYVFKKKLGMTPTKYRKQKI